MLDLPTAYLLFSNVFSCLNITVKMFKIFQNCHTGTEASGGYDASMTGGYPFIAIHDKFRKKSKMLSSLT